MKVRPCKRHWHRKVTADQLGDVVDFVELLICVLDRLGNIQIKAKKGGPFPLRVSGRLWNGDPVEPIDRGRRYRAPSPSGIARSPASPKPAWRRRIHWVSEKPERSTADTGQCPPAKTGLSSQAPLLVILRRPVPSLFITQISGSTVISADDE